MAFELKSPAFADGAEVPRRHTCDGANLSPALSWTDPPAGTKSLALVCEDPDAPRGTWSHWVVWGVPAAARKLSEGVPPERTRPDGMRQGTNDFGKVGYGGPCPPPDGQVHHYIFTVYALSVAHIPGTHITFGKLIAEISPDVVGATSTIGKFRLPLGS